MGKLDRASFTVLRLIAFGLILSFLSFLLFLFIAFGVLNGSLKYVDNAILAVIYSLRNPLVTQIMHVLSFLGGEFMVLSETILLGFLVYKKYKKEAVFFTFTVLFGYALNNLSKYLLKIPRPDIDALTNAGFYSFPSGHGMNSLIFYGLLAYLTFHFTRSRPLGILVAVFSIIIVLLVGFSRLYLGVHYPSDILAGFILGFWWLTTAIAIFKAWEFYRLTKRRQK